MTRTIMLSIGALLLPAMAAAFLLSPVGSAHGTPPVSAHAHAAKRLDLSGFPDAPPAQPLQLLFIHHSCGGQLLAAPGPAAGANCIHTTHPNGGGLRALLERNNYQVHEASYGSLVGQDTDIFDWLPKFRDQMDLILTCDRQDTRYQDGRRNRIVVFKSCFPNNAFVAAGSAPGNPAGPELTVWNAKAAYTALLDEFRKHPDVLFVCLTAPPLAPQLPPQALWKKLARKVMGRAEPSPAASAPLAREFNNWLAGTDGWLKDGQPANVVVFDYYHILTGDGASDLSAYATANGCDSHPSQAGNTKAAQAFVPFLNRAVRRAGLSQ